MEQAPEAPESIAPWTVQQALEQARARGLERIDAQMLLLHALGRPLHDRAWLLTHDTDTLPASVQAQYTALCARRQAGEPVAYLTGRKAFYGLELQVDARVLDPRPDTETLVDWALQLLQARTAPRIVDLGTGSGAIALALQSQRPDARVLAVDASAGAIVANPPYIPQADPHLAALRHEPLAALASGADGLADLRAIIAQAPACLAPGGWLLLEHGWDQAPAVCALLQEAGFAAVQTRKDLAGIVRCSGGQWPGMK